MSCLEGALRIFLLIFVLTECRADLDKRTAFEEFKLRYKRSYKHPREATRRFEIFSNNVDHIEEHNQKYENGLTRFRMGLNEYADWPLDEFQTYSYGNIEEEDKPQENKTYFEGTEEAGNNLESSLSTEAGRLGSGRRLTLFNTGWRFLPKPTAAVPDEIDWRQLGAVTPVQSQKKCGSCWTFSTTGALEGQLFRKTGKLVPLSQQQLVDCSDGQYHSNGCHGGMKELAFLYVRDYGLNSAEAYPYEAKETGQCNFRPNETVATCKGYRKIRPLDEHAMKVAVAKIGPISATIDGRCLKMRFYKEGIFDEHNCKTEKMGHGVLIVGYGHDNRTNLDYWILKNSWGAGWGMDGFALIPRNVNFAGIAKRASFPVV